MKTKPVLFGSKFSFIFSCLFFLLTQMSRASLIICGPSGVGKSSIISAICSRFPSRVALSVSHTSRQPRPGEKNGVDYFFTTPDAMLRDIEKKAFLEYAHVHNNIYGTSRSSVDTILDKGMLPILDVDRNGVQSIKAVPGFEAKYVFIAPPSFDVLHKRLSARATENDEDMHVRLNNAKSELDYGTTKGNFDRVIVNADLDESVDQLTETMIDWFPWISQGQT